jgi:hypothetical protein
LRSAIFRAKSCPLGRKVVDRATEMKNMMMTVTGSVDTSYSSNLALHCPGRLANVSTRLDVSYECNP